MKKKIILVLAIVLLFTVGCGGQGNPEDTVKNYFEAVKEFDEDEMNSSLANKDENVVKDMKESEDSEFNDYLIDMMKENASELEYKIISAETEENQAKVVAKLKYKDSSQLIMETISEFFVSAMGSAFSDEEMTNENTEEMFVDIIKEKAQTVKEEVIEKEITVSLIKVDGEWLIEETTTEMQNAITSNIVGAFSEMESSMEFE